MILYYFYTSTKFWRGYIFTEVCLCVCVCLCLCVRHFLWTKFTDAPIGTRFSLNGSFPHSLGHRHTDKLKWKYNPSTISWRCKYKSVVFRVETKWLLTPSILMRHFGKTLINFTEILMTSYDINKSRYLFHNLFRVGRLERFQFYAWILQNSHIKWINVICLT